MAHIILAEDDTPMRQFLRTALEKAGHRVDDYPDGETALAALQRIDSQADVLLADIVMPGLDGISLAQQAMELHPHIKVLFITGFAGVALNNKDLPTIAQPAPKIMSKPFHLRDLVAQVDALLAA